MKKLLLSFILLCNCAIALEITGAVIKIADGDTITILDNNKSFLNTL